MSKKEEKVSKKVKAGNKKVKASNKKKVPRITKKMIEQIKLDNKKVKKQIETSNGILELIECEAARTNINNNNYFKAVILKYLGEVKIATKVQIEQQVIEDFSDKLTLKQKQEKVRSLIKALIKDEQISRMGKTKGVRWKLKDYNPEEDTL